MKYDAMMTHRASRQNRHDFSLHSSRVAAWMGRLLFPENGHFFNPSIISMLSSNVTSNNTRTPIADSAIKRKSLLAKERT